MAKKKSSVPSYSPKGFIVSLALLAGVSSAFLASRIIASESSRYGFLFWNLILAAAPLILAWWLVLRINRYGWAKWQQAALTLLWVLFLPNSFYIITDLVHLRQNYEADLLFDISMITAFIVSGLIMGITSVFLIHREIIKRTTAKAAYAWVGLIILAASFAICLGRYTRWNTWDIVLRPAGLLFDVSDRLINPGGHLQTYQTTGVMFLVLFCIYAVVWEAALLLKRR